MKSETTIYDVAGKAGVSITTVSRVLNSPNKVSEKTRDNVMDVIRELKFTPKAEAVARARSNFKRIGVLLPFFTTPSFIQRIRGVMNQLDDNEFEVIIYSVKNYDQLREYLTVLPFSGRIDGLIIMALPFNDDDLDHFFNAKLAVVSIEFAHSELSHVIIDNEYGGKMAAEHLLSTGRTKLGFIGEGGEPAYSLHASDERLKGFSSYAKQKGFALSDNCIVHHPYGMEQAISSAETLLSINERPDGIFAASDIEAVAVIKAAEKLNLAIPEDVSIIGFDDIDLAGYMGITTINQSLDESGKIAVQLLIELMEDPEIIHRKVSLNLKLVKRKTT